MPDPRSPSKLDLLLADLTDPQREAVTHVDGPLLIVAGAGSGKTRVITRRVAYLVALGIEPRSILAITFTNKAAGEMKARIASVADRKLYDFGRLDQPWPTVCTFHSLCLRILRHYSTRVGLPLNFSIFDSSDQTKLIKEAIKILDLSTTNFSPSTVHGTISNAKNQLVGPEQYASNAKDFYQKNVARAYGKYQALLAQNNALDFDDLLIRTAQAFRDFPDVLAELQERFQYILIDEYQDTNHAQYIIAHAMAQGHRNICVVGDPDQSIYAWRGADIKNILEFERDYPDAVVVRLEQNYRSTKTVLAIASKLIANNLQRKKKSLWTENPQGDAAEVYHCQDEHDEAAIVMSRLKELNEKQKVAWSEMAIFYRMNSLSRVMEEALFKNKVPYQIARGTEFYNRKEIKDVLAYLRVVANPSDEVSLTRIVNVPTRGLGDSSIKQMTVHAVGRGMSLFQAMTRAAEIPGVSTRAVAAARNFVQMVERWRTFPGIMPAGGPPQPNAAADAVLPDETSQPQSSIAETPAPEAAAAAEPAKPARRKNRAQPQNDLFTSDSAAAAGLSPSSAAAALIDHPTADAPTNEPPAEPSTVTTLPANEAAAPPPAKGHVRAIMEDVLRKSGLTDALRKADAGKEEGEKATDNVNELISAAAEYDRANPDGSLADYLAAVSLVSDADHMKGHGGAVTLMTLHAAKGLEFPVVAMIGLEEGILPHSRAAASVVELEEERRLCFVGITRAEKVLILTKAGYRTVRGLRERTVTSPFLKELPPENLKVIDRTDIATIDSRWDQRLTARAETSSELGRLRLASASATRCLAWGTCEMYQPRARAFVRWLTSHEAARRS